MINISFSLNGSRLFGASRGLRQGDPLSPFLFTIVAEALGALLSKAKDLGMIRGFETRKGGEAITHLQFTDNTMLFSYTKANIEMLSDCFRLED